mmetsp:Transcript_6821/g.23965  ORF Transcript_6821/g.23965 Transcript_6821/m.23965 type:complete len:95 (+) Transcript_6821:1244-1528(+)
MLERYEILLFFSYLSFFPFRILALALALALVLVLFLASSSSNGRRAGSFLCFPIPGDHGRPNTRRRECGRMTTADVSCSGWRYGSPSSLEGCRG